jgi:hypothetical protein
MQSGESQPTFRGTYSYSLRVHIAGCLSVVTCLSYSSLLNMEVICSFTGLHSFIGQKIKKVLVVAAVKTLNPI